MTRLATLLWLAVLLLSAQSSVAGQCVGKFANPITDICWSCLFPMTLKILASLAEPYTLQVHSGDPHRQPVSHRCTASIGLVIFGSRDNASPEDLTKWADVAMYQAESEGRDRISFARQT